MARAAYFDCASGASGNMLLGAFLDAGGHLDTVGAALTSLGLGDAAVIHPEQRMKGTTRATHVEIDVRQPRPWRNVGEIDRLIASAALDEGVKERSRLAFRLLANAEGRAHGVDPAQVRLHETGAIDAVIDVVGTFALALELGVEAFYASALPLSEGETQAAHGRIPLPAPATVNILSAVGAPTYHKEGGHELVTPTGAAILGACATFSDPAVSAELEGFGAGTSDLPWPNVLRLVIGEVADAVADSAPLLVPGAGLSEETVAVLETAIDDMPANLLADVMAGMLGAGALDAYLTPVLMKKGRAAHLVTVICMPADADRLGDRLIRETPTLGVRVREQRRVVAERRLERLSSSIGEVGVKLKLVGGRVIDAAPEHDDVVRQAGERGIPVAEAHRRVTIEARRTFMEGTE